MSLSKTSQKVWLDTSIREELIRCYSETDILERKIIGHGGSGVVYRTRLKHPQIQVAMKTLFLNQYGCEEDHYKQLVKELKTHKKVDDHPNVIRFLGLCKDSHDNYHMIFEYATDGSLREYLEKNFDNLQWRDKLRLGMEIASGLRYLHDLDIIHKDLSSSNVLIQGGTAKITDFGLSSMLKQIMSTSHGNGHTAYIDPSSFKYDSYRRTKKSDIFSLGVLLWEVSSGKKPCKECTKSHEIVIFRMKGFRDAPVEGVPVEYVKLYEGCWDEDPNQRPTSEQVHNTLIEQYGPESNTEETAVTSREVSRPRRNNRFKRLVKRLIRSNR